MVLTEKEAFAFVEKRLAARGIVLPLRQIYESMPAVRPAGYEDLPPEQQWRIDRELGILDDD